MTEVITKPDGPNTSSPMLAKASLGMLVWKLFKSSGLTIEQVAAKATISKSAADRWLKGNKRLTLRDVRDLCDALGADELMTRELLKLARDANKRDVTQQMDWAGPSDFLLFVEFERAATEEWTYETSLVPGALQTPQYAEVVIRGTHHDEQVVADRVRLRMERQRILHREQDPTMFTAVLDESVLHRKTANRSVMREQLRHLLMLGELPNVTIRVIPYAAGPLASGSVGAFTVMRLPQLGRVAYVETPAVATYLETGTALYVATAKRLEGHALDPNDSAKMIEAVLSEIG